MMTTLTFFNNKGGVGKTSLVYHLACLYSDLGLNVVAADLDPQANLTSMFLENERLEELWGPAGRRRTVYGALEPLLEGTGDVIVPHLEETIHGPYLVVGDLCLSSAEDELSIQWPSCLDKKPRAFRVLSSLWRILDTAASKAEAELVLVDVGPNLGSLNRAALVATDYVAVPLAPDLFSLQGLKNLGPTLKHWREGWSDRQNRNPVSDIRTPDGSMTPIGYIVMQHAVRLDRPVKAYARWMERIPEVYTQEMQAANPRQDIPSDTVPECLAKLKHYRSLMPLAQEARKPMFALKSADGAIGGHANAVRSCYRDFRDLALVLARRVGVPLP